MYIVSKHTLYTHTMGCNYKYVQHLHLSPRTLNGPLSLNTIKYYMYTTHRVEVFRVCNVQGRNRKGKNCNSGGDISPVVEKQKSVPALAVWVDAVVWVEAVGAVYRGREKEQCSVVNEQY